MTKNNNQREGLGGGYIQPETNYSYHGLQTHLGRYSFASGFVKGKTILDIGCGIGYGTSRLTEGEPQMVVGGDISIDAISVANRKYKPGQSNLQFLVMDASRLPFAPESFDVITAFEVIEHLKHYNEFLGEISRCLKEGGIFICSTPNKEVVSPGKSTTSWTEHFKEFYPLEFQDLLGGHFVDIHLYGQEFVQGKVAGVKRKVIHLLALAILAVPGAKVLSNWVARLIAPQYRLLRLGEVTTVDVRYIPRALEDAPVQSKPSVIIAAATISRRKGTTQG